MLSIGEHLAIVCFESIKSATERRTCFKNSSTVKINNRYILRADVPNVW